MKNILLVFLFGVLVLRTNAQEQKQVNATKLIEIIAKGDFSILVKLVSSLNYLVLDSNRDKAGDLFYFTKEPKYHGNELACSADAKSKITELTFNTFVKKDNFAMKSEILGSGFKSSGLHKDKISDLIESEDFEKGNILVATSTRSKDGVTFYEFTFLKL